MCKFRAKRKSNYTFLDNKNNNEKQHARSSSGESAQRAKPRRMTCEKNNSSWADENEKRPRKNTKDIKPYNIEQEQNLLENAVKIHRRTFPAVSSPVLLRGTLGLYPIHIYTYHIHIYIYMYIEWASALVPPTPS